MDMYRMKYVLHLFFMVYMDNGNEENLGIRNVFQACGWHTWEML